MKRGDAPPAGASGTRAPGQQIRPASIPSSARYDLFLAHSPGGRPSANALYSLLQGATIALPPLRQRGGDVLLLAEHFLAQAAAALRRPVWSLHARARERLLAHHWPGNVRLGAEIVTAIELHRAAPDTHRIIPVLLAQGVSVPYGLSHVQVLDASGDTLPNVAIRLRAIVASPSSA